MSGMRVSEKNVKISGLKALMLDTYKIFIQ